MIEFDRILDKIGHLGRYQLIICACVFWLGVPAGLHNIASVFYAADIPFRCKVPPLDNSSLYMNLSEADILNYTTPPIGDDYDTCRRYGYNLSSCEPPSLDCVDMSATAIACDNGYHYDTSVFTSTVNTEWTLVCDRKILGTVATSIYFAGMWTGAIVFGYLADYIGRRNTMLITSIGCLISGISTAFTPWFELFVVLRFLSAAFSHGSFLFMFVYVVEITGKERTITGVHTHTAFALGYTLNSLVSYFLRDWRWFYFVISLTPIPYIIIHFFIPDSPRWHFSNGRNEIGRKLAEKFARHNRKVLTEKDWQMAEVSQTKKKVADRTYTSLDLFKTRRMRLITFNSMYNWLVIAMVYYGLSLNAGALAGDIFLNNALNGLVELIGYFFVQFTMDRYGRKSLLVFMMVLQGMACIMSTVLTTLADDNQAMITSGVVFAFIGKIGVGGSFAIIFNYTAELYPTVVRGNALGIGSMAARIGSISSPYIILLQDYVSWLPTTIFGVLSVTAGLTALSFPETMNRTMPQTIPEAELFYQGIYENKKDAESSEVVSVSTEPEVNPITKM